MIPNLVSLVREQKALAKRNQAVRNGVLFVGVCIGTLAAMVWLLADPGSGPNPAGKLLLGVGAGAALGHAILSIRKSALFSRSAACPTCGQDWEIREGRVPPMERMPNWDRCPGCGTLMNEVLLAKRS